MTLTASRPRPPASARAALISRCSASRLAASTSSRSAASGAWPLVRAIRSGWWRRRSIDEMVPIAPLAATLPASRCADTPTPMPPCTTGSSSRPASRSGASPPALQAASSASKPSSRSIVLPSIAAKSGRLATPSCRVLVLSSAGGLKSESIAQALSWIRSGQSALRDACARGGDGMRRNLDEHPVFLRSLPLLAASHCPR